jgi:hypothetical protein
MTIGRLPVVDKHIRSAVAAAKRKGLRLEFSRFAQRLRARNPAIKSDDAYILRVLTLASAEQGVRVNLDR